MGRALSFCSVLRDYLVADPYFIQTAGYAQERQSYGIAHRWDELKDQAYWRGTDTGVFRYRTYAAAPRVAAALMSRERPDILDARITRIELRPGHIEKEAWYHEMGLMGPEEDQANILNYRYQIDIDGNTNTWSSLFLKLLTGTPVLKVESEFGFRQWYYDLLVPWENYVPVASDASDLIEKIEWLRANPEQARKIGLAGRRLADSVTYEESIKESHATLARLVALNRRRNI
nr:glycosyl transferase family 90 [Sphingomonas crocodyli]